VLWADGEILLDQVAFKHAGHILATRSRESPPITTCVVGSVALFFLSMVINYMTGKLITGSRFYSVAGFCGVCITRNNNISADQPGKTRNDFAKIAADTSYAVGDDFNYPVKNHRTKLSILRLASSLRMTPGLGRSGCALQPVRKSASMASVLK